MDCLCGGNPTQLRRMQKGGDAFADCLAFRCHLDGRPIPRHAACFHVNNNRLIRYNEIKNLKSISNKNKNYGGSPCDPEKFKYVYPTLLKKRNIRLVYPPN